MNERRPDIPAELRRRVLVEAGNRCAIPTCRYLDVDIHHIEPWKECREHSYENLIALCPNCHRRVEKGEIDRKSQRMYKANLRIAHDKFSQFEIDTLFALSETPEGKGIPWPAYLNLLLKRLFDAEYVRLHEVGGTQMMLGKIKLTPDMLAITDGGRKFVESLGLSEIE